MKIWKINLLLLGLNVGAFYLFTGPASQYFNPPPGPLQVIKTQARSIYTKMDAFNAQVQRATGQY